MCLSIIPPVIINKLFRFLCIDAEENLITLDTGTHLSYYVPEDYATTAANANTSYQQS